MKVGLDFHGVINTSPAFFSLISKLLIDAGHEVHIITGNDIDIQLLRELEEYNIKYTTIFSIVDHHHKIGTPIEWKENGPWMDKELWNKTKAEYCKKKRIDIMIDDSERYGVDFETPFILWKKLKK